MFRLTHSDEDSFLFNFSHQNYPKLEEMIHYWQAHDLENQRSMDEARLNFTILLTLISRFMMSHGFNSEHIFDNNRQTYSRMKELKNLEDFHRFETKEIQDYFQLFELRHRKTEHLIVNQILNYIYVHLHQKIQLEQLASTLKVSKSHCQRVFKQEMDCTITQFVNQLKVERAEYFLTSTHLSIMDISLTLGYHDQSHFSKTFKSITGITPRQYRIKHQT